MEKPLPPPPRLEGLDEQMLRWLQQIPELIPRISVHSFVLNPANVVANTASTQSFTASGLSTSDVIFVKASLAAGLRLYANAQVPTDDRLQLEFQNTTGGDINQASATFDVVAIR